MRSYREREEKQAYKRELVMMLKELSPCERSAKIKELTDIEHNIACYGKRTLSKSTIYGWMKECEELPPDGVLLPAIRSDYGEFRHITSEQSAALIRWRKENAYRSVKKLREELLAHEITREPPLSESTIARFLNSKGLDRKSMRIAQGTSKIRLSYEAPYPQRIWVADTKGPNLYVQPGVIAKLILFLDDNSRYVVACAYVLTENEEEVIYLFRQGLTRFGVPDILYLDHGSPYSGGRLKTAAALIGCRVLHTPVKDAPAKGKSEKMLQTVYQQLETELLLWGKPPTLEQANEYLAAFISQDYHKKVHSVTGQTPIDRYSAFPAEYRRFISAKSSGLIFLPLAKSKVNKTGLITLNKRKYLVPDARLYCKWVEVRYDPHDLNRVHVWIEHTYYGEAGEYEVGNDYLKRQTYLEELITKPETELRDAPPYTYLERKLAAYRIEISTDLNEELELNKVKREKVKSILTMIVTPPEMIDTPSEISETKLTYLLTVLLSKSFTSNERLMIRTAWHTYGPFEEDVIRSAIGKLLGQHHPASDLAAYLEAIRLATEYTTTRQKGDKNE